MPITVAIVEDEPELREELSTLIAGSAALRFLRACGTGEEALKELPKQAPEVVVMDINLPGMSGVECTLALKALLPETQILMLTMFDDAERIFGALRSGASGYLLKRSAAAELIVAIEQVHEGGSPISPQIARKVVQFFRAEPRKAAVENADDLTERERELLSLLARGKQYKEIADQLGISTDTVRSHIRRIYRKLHVHSRTEATVKFLGA
jgi:RNA polymerase sigma factor (sigma-70 family)